MSFGYNRQSQFELFPGAQNSPKENARSPFASAILTLSMENLIVSGVVVIMVMVLAFSLGVQKGRRLVREKEAADPAPVVMTAAVQWEQPQLFPETPPLAKETKTASAVNAGLAKEKALPVVEEKAADKFYTIQVASYKQKEHAQKEAMDLKKRGYESIVISKGGYVIVCVGKFGRHDDAKVFSNKLKNRYKDCLVRSL